MMLRPRADRQAPAASSSRRPAAANPLYRAFMNNWEFEPITAQPTIASADSDRQPGVASTRRDPDAAERYNGVVEQATENELADAAAARGSHRHVQLPAHRRGARGAREARRPRRGAARPDRVIVISTANGLKFTEFKIAYHTRSLARRDAALSQPSGRIAQQLRRRASSDR